MQDEVHRALIELQKRALAVERADLAEHASAVWLIVEGIAQTVEAEEAGRRVSRHDGLRSNQGG